ncbi:serine/threonine-protein kinase/endoribonuclease IRE1a-like isoform X2 [Trifolium pratense]|uniref:serine/threonine-protein kinase/endoribonuclease IRE1a-like isoform X2 n=1 Tax=Trifolium pratense TaxID=57577 RepID=UPI001E68FF60|nr:serine/threonine-protein kinase/endoribonuclease IRE1a-like isoform X2 [Trifolium pratense]
MKLLFLFIFLLLSLLNQQHCSVVNTLSRSPTSRSILSLPPPKAATTALVAALDGTMYLVASQENGAVRVIWSFSTGSPIYSSYQAPINKDRGKTNTSSAPTSGFVECGDDWSLYMHDKILGKMRLSESIGEFVHRAPIISDDGTAIFGYKEDSLFEVEAKTGSIIQIHAKSDPGNASAPLRDDRLSAKNIITEDNKDLADPKKLNSSQPLLMLFRKDYTLKSVNTSSKIVLWNLTVTEFEAVLLCQHTTVDVEDEIPSDRGLNFAMPYPCQEMQNVFRLKKNFLLEPLITESLPGPFYGYDGIITFLPTPLPYSMPYLQQNNDKAYKLPQPLIEITSPGDVYLNKSGWSTPLHLIVLTVFLLVSGFSVICFLTVKVVKNQDIPKDQNREYELKSSPAKRKKRKKMHKSGKNSDTIDKMENYLSSEDEDALTRNDTNREEWENFNQVDEGFDGRKIGKLFVSNEEIAKGSNGTIVLDGRYEGRPVAVKRLVKAHHKVAYKEIRNLIVSDRHPNIVRWHGVEYDQDFIYLALERCTCNLDDLIKGQMETGKDNTQYLWKENGYPSALLLKLMRDIVSGVVHLHDLGIIHRDLKPQNVLINNERSLCAKLSDMGISKLLLENMSSLGHNATGGGSSGWQAPEQLDQGRQTRAVDMFSLGCILFFCMTRGRHPFGQHIERDINIVKNKKNLCLVQFIPEAEDLISCLLNHDPDLRPKAIEVLHHPFFWSSETRLSFLRDTSDRVELEDKNLSSGLLRALESIATTALGGKWDENMEPAFIANISRYRRYKFNSVRDLLRVMRNKLNHYGELPQEIQLDLFLKDSMTTLQTDSQDS